jgi:hypothetical protein
LRASSETRADVRSGNQAADALEPSVAAGHTRVRGGGTWVCGSGAERPIWMFARAALDRQIVAQRATDERRPAAA